MSLVTKFPLCFNYFINGVKKTGDTHQVKALRAEPDHNTKHKISLRGSFLPGSLSRVKSGMPSSQPDFSCLTFCVVGQCERRFPTVRQDVGDCPLPVAGDWCIVGDTRLSWRGLRCLDRCWDRSTRGPLIVPWLRQWFDHEARLFPSRSSGSAATSCWQLIVCVLLLLLLQDLLFR